MLGNINKHAVQQIINSIHGPDKLAALDDLVEAGIISSDDAIVILYGATFPIICVCDRMKSQYYPKCNRCLE